MADFVLGVLWRTTVVALVLSAGQIGWKLTHQPADDATRLGECEDVVAAQAWFVDVDQDNVSELVVSDGERLAVLEPAADGRYNSGAC